MEPIQTITAEAIRAADQRISDAAFRTPLLRLDPTPVVTEAPGRAGDPQVTDGPANRGVWLKLECLQPIGSFKIRGAANAMALASRDALQDGVYTASAGNMAQGVAFAARRLGVPCRVLVPESAPRTKVEAVERLGGTVRTLPFDRWWRTIMEHGHPDESGFFVHPVSDPAVIAGNGTVGLEIAEELPDVAAVVVPYGGGGLATGVASWLKARHPGVRILAAEVETAAPFAASLRSGRPVSVDRTPTFVDGIGGSSVLEEMWPLASSVLDGSRVVALDAVCAAIRRLATEAHVVSEGAGGAAVAAALELADEVDGPVVAVVSGGNIDPDALATILEGGLPGPAA